MNGSVNVPGYSVQEVEKIINDFKMLLADYAQATHDHKQQILYPHGIELTPAEGSKHGGYIDFHHPDEEEGDNTTRICEYIAGALTYERNGKVIGTLPAMKQGIATLTAAGWADMEQTVTVDGVTANNVVITAPAPANLYHCQEHNVVCIAQSDGKLTFRCDKVLSFDVAVHVLILT